MTTHRIPTHTVLLGAVLDCEIDTGDARVFVPEWSEMMLLAPSDAIERKPGYGRLYAVRLAGTTEAEKFPPGSLRRGKPNHADAVQTYVEWTRRDPCYAPSVDVPESASRAVGRCTRLDYRSDKWNARGRFVDYTHSFTESDGIPPLVYVNKTYLEDATLVVISGGDFEVRREGIS